MITIENDGNGYKITFQYESEEGEKKCPLIVQAADPDEIAEVIHHHHKTIKGIEHIPGSRPNRCPLCRLYNQVLHKTGEPS